MLTHDYSDFCSHAPLPVTPLVAPSQEDIATTPYVMERTPSLLAGPQQPTTQIPRPLWVPPSWHPQATPSPYATEEYPTEPYTPPWPIQQRFNH